jgi:Tfp pilus assembly protein PilN
VIRINLAPPTQTNRGMRAALVILPCAAVAGAILAGLGWGFALRGEEVRLAAQVAALSQELAAVQPMLGAAARARATADDLARRARVLEELGRGRGAMIRTLDGLLDVVPREVSLAGLDARGGDLRATGSAATARAVADFAANLRASGGFRDVEIAVSRRDLGQAPPGPVGFEITCRMGP